MDFKGSIFNSDDYELTDEFLDQGVFGRIRLIKQKTDDKEYAAKIINISSEFNSANQMELMLNFPKLQKVSHPALIEYVGLNFQSLEDRSLFEPTVITVFLQNGNLTQFLEKDENPQWTITKKCITILGISNALKFLHKNEILHRDLKPENIIFDENYYPHVSDYGLSKCFPQILSKILALSLTKNFTSPAYFAPELFDEEKEEFHNNLAVDVYSFGILALQILTGNKPYAELGKLSAAKLAQKIIAGERPQFTDDVSEKMKALITKCLNKNIDERPTFDKIFAELSDYKAYFGEDVDSGEVDKYLKIISKEKVEAKQVKVKDKKESADDENAFEKERIQKRLNEKQNDYADLIKVLVRNIENVDEIEIKKNSLLQSACNLGNTEVVKYIISSNEKDINEKGIFLFVFF